MVKRRAEEKANLDKTKTFRLDEVNVQESRSPFLFIFGSERSLGSAEELKRAKEES